MRSLLLGLLLLGLSGCATTNQFKKNMEAWVGEPQDAVLTRFGPPEASTEFSDGDKQISYTLTGERRTTAAAFGNMAHSRSYQESCIIRFRIDPKSNKVVGASWVGNACY